MIRHGVTVDDWVLRCAKAEVSRVAKLTRQKHGQLMTQSNPLALPLLPIDRQSMLGRVTPWAAGQALRRWDGRVPNCTNFPLCSPQVLSLVARNPNQARRMQGRVFLKISPFLTAGRCLLSGIEIPISWVIQAAPLARQCHGGNASVRYTDGK